jgi:hypothetical protein
MRLHAWGPALALAVAAQGGLAADLPKFGAHPAQPEVEVAYDRRFDLRATLVQDRSGAPATEVTKAVQLRFDLAFRAAEGAREGDLALTCRIVLVEADGKQSAPVRDGPCYEGPLVTGGGWVPVGAPVRFRPGREAPAGSAGVIVEVREGKGRVRKLVATYGWAPDF